MKEGTREREEGNIHMSGISISIGIGIGIFHIFHIFHDFVKFVLAVRRGKE